MPVTEFIDLQRRFRDLRDAELEQDVLEDTDILVSLGETEFGSSVGWAKILEHPRVVILAEAGAGKSTEMEQQSMRLVKEGRFAFYVMLESLGSEPMTSQFSPPVQERFEAWKADGHEPAWFFLDAVDELKLSRGKLDRTLLQFSIDVDGHLGRASVAVSSRPSDWRPSGDLATVRKRLPVPEEIGEIVEQERGDVFREALQVQRVEIVRFRETEQEDRDRNAIWTVKMLPLSNFQIAQFADKRGVRDASGFLNEIARQNAWDFGRRPLDLKDLVANWMSLGRLGTRTEQHEGNVAAKLRDDPERRDNDVLSDSQARFGAQVLALGLTLTRMQTIRSSEQAADGIPQQGVLDAAAILPGWTEAQRQALLRRGLFDPATYGRIRFHHRSVQEYLAACCLRRLRERNMSTSALFGLLFGERYGVEVVRPSMRAVAAWLALWDGDVRGELIKREPEVLLSYGDAGTLELDARVKLLRAFVRDYGHGGWRGLEIGVEEIGRLSHHGLASVVRQCWQEGGSAKPEVGEVLLELIRQGPLVACADLASSAALDPSGAHNYRISAVRALVACGEEQTLRVCVSAMLVDDGTWPNEVICHVAVDLFPKFISADELVKLIEDRLEPGAAAWSFNWMSHEIVESVEAWSEPAVALRDRIADLIWRRREPEQEPEHRSGGVSYLAPPLGRLCDRQLFRIDGEAGPDLIRACVVASRFVADGFNTNKALGRIQAWFETNTSSRSAVCWQDLALMDEISPTDDDWTRYYHTAHGGILGQLKEVDRPWLETALADEGRPERHTLALHGLIDLWRARGRNRSELDEIRKIAKKDEGLLRVLTERTTLSSEEADKTMASMEREGTRRSQVNAARAAKRLEAWEKWRAELLDDPDGAFAGERRAATVTGICSWLRERSQDRQRFNTWDKSALTMAFGLDVAERAEAALGRLWRDNPPVLWSARAAEARNSFPQDWIQGLVGVSAESRNPGWSKRLASEEARTAAAYATIEMNGFAPFIADLADSHHAEVEGVIGDELSAELELGGDEQHLPTLQHLGHADGIVKRLLVPRLVVELTRSADDFTKESGATRLHHLDRVLRILSEAEGEEDRKTIARECRKRCEVDPASPLGFMWLRSLFQFDPQSGATVLMEALRNDRATEMSERAVETFAALFGGYDPVTFEISDSAACASVLGDLVRCAYALVRREDDVVHEGAYTSNTRDDAQTARNHLLSRLLDTPGPDAHRVVLELSREEDFAHFADRLRLLARRKAVADAELEPLEPAAIIALEDNLEAPPQDRDGLFTIMMDRLEDLAHYFRHGDFSDRRLVQRSEQESEVQSTLASRLVGNANGAYIITREEEVADQKRTDIRFLSVRGGKKAVAEVKIADNWSLNQLEHALREQLVGQYLRHADCKAGCLLLTYHGRKHYWKHPGSANRLEFQEIVAILRVEAKRIEIETSYEVRLSVFGIDLTDPVPESSCPASLS